MLDALTRSLRPYGAGVLLLGLVGVVFREFALQWHFVPETVPYRTALAYVSSALLVAGGVAVLTPRTASRAALLVGCLLALWALIVHVPRVMAAPGNVALWLGLAEIALLAVSGVTGWVMTRGMESHEAAMRVARRLVAICLLIFALSHFVYADFTATMVPGWIPAGLFWAYATGGAHLAAGLSLMTGMRALLASSLLAAMFASFVVLVHVPRVLGDPTNHAEWGLLAASLSMTGAVWVIRASLAGRLNSAARLPRDSGPLRDSV